MTTEHGYTPSNELLILSSRVNRVCELEPGASFEVEQLREDCQAIIESLHPILAETRDHITGGFITPKSPGKLMATNTGHLIQGPDRSVKTDVSFTVGQVFEDRIGNYKVTKSKEWKNMSLNFHYFLLQIMDSGYRVGSGEATHVLYDSTSLKFDSLVRSKPYVLTVLGAKIVYYKHFPIYGSAKIETSTLEFYL